MSAAARRVLVTGASGGIGAACARRLAQAGWDLVLHAGHQRERVQALADELGSTRNVAVWQHDLLSDGIDASLGPALAQGPITGFVHAAGVAAEGLAVRLKDDDIAAALQVNLVAAMAIVRALSRGLLAARWGRIVLLGSTAGLAGNGGQSLYGATKMGLIGYARGLARELAGRSVTVNVVAPGWIETTMTAAILERRREEILASIPAGRTGTSDEVAAAVAFLMSDDAGYVTGQTLCVNGGLWML